MKKKAIAVLVTGVMVMASMTACGADTKEAEPAAAMTEEAAEEETTEEEAEEETAANDIYEGLEYDADADAYYLLHCC